MSLSLPSETIHYHTCNTNDSVLYTHEYVVSTWFIMVLHDVHTYVYGMYTPIVYIPP